VGDRGLVALGRAAGAGALGALQTLYVHRNCVGDEGARAFAGALAATAFPALEKLWIYKNRVGDAGLGALRDALLNGRLARLTSLQVEGNPASNEAQIATIEAVKQRGAVSVTLKLAQPQPDDARPMNNAWPV
jgi:hypothetical protein